MRSLRLASVLLLAILLVRLAPAGDEVQSTKSGKGVECPHCHHICQSSCETAKEKKHAWDMKVEPLCIPKCRFPWHSHALSKGGKDCCEGADCAKVRYVRKLVKREYECEVCKQKWTAVCADCGKATGEQSGK